MRGSARPRVPERELGQVSLWSNTDGDILICLACSVPLRCVFSDLEERARDDDVILLDEIDDDHVVGVPQKTDVGQRGSDHER